MPQIISPHDGKPIQSKPPELYVFDPEADITASEVALFVRDVFMVMNVALNEVALEQFPEGMRRHFTRLELPETSPANQKTAAHK